MVAAFRASHHKPTWVATEASTDQGGGWSFDCYGLRFLAEDEIDIYTGSPPWAQLLLPPVFANACASALPMMFDILTLGSNEGSPTSDMEPPAAESLVQDKGIVTSVTLRGGMLFVSQQE
jgi:hypothetical protein